MIAANKVGIYWGVALLVVVVKFRFVVSRRPHGEFDDPACNEVG